VGDIIVAAVAAAAAAAGLPSQQCVEGRGNLLIHCRDVEVSINAKHGSSFLKQRPRDRYLLCTGSGTFWWFCFHLTSISIFQSTLS
jgi:hypothetical protein